MSGTQHPRGTSRQAFYFTDGTLQKITGVEGDLNVPGDLFLGGTLVATLPAADALASATTTIDVSGSPAPSAGNVLEATSATSAVWSPPNKTADLLATTGASVDVSAAAPGVLGDILTLTSPTTAVWQAPSTTATALATTGSDVVVSAAAPGIAGDVLTLTSPTTAVWQAASGGGDLATTLTAGNQINTGQQFLLQATTDNIVWSEQDLSGITGTRNLIIGPGAGDNITTGDNNICLGWDAGASIAALNGNVCIGNAANSTGSVGVGIGSGAVCNSNGVSVGLNATGGVASTALGLNATANGGNGVAAGNNSNCSGLSGVAVGINTDATQNFAVAVGASAQATGANSIAIGGNSTTANSARASNVNAISIGMNTSTSGNSSVTVGANSFNSGITSTCLGPQTFCTHNDSVCVGNGAQSVVPNSWSTFTGWATLTGTSIVYDGVTGQIGPDSSTLRVKNNVADYEAPTDIIDQLRPVQYNRKGSETLEVGLIAEDLDAIGLNEFVAYGKWGPIDEEGQRVGEVEKDLSPVGIKYDRMVALLIGEIQSLRKRVAALETK